MMGLDDVDPAVSLQEGRASGFRKGWRWVLGAGVNPIPAPRRPDRARGGGLAGKISQRLGYQMLRLEYALSPRGHIRAWLLLNVRLSALGLIPIFTVLPVATALLAQAVSVTGLAVVLVQNILIALVLTVVLVLVVSAIAMGLAAARARRQGGDRA